MFLPLALVSFLLLLFKSPVQQSQQKRPLVFSDINFLHTTDTHGWYSGHINQKTYDADWGDFVLFASHMKEKAAEQGQDLLLVDSGDRHDGNGLSDITVPNGEKSLPIFMQQHYDIITLGNHELYLAENSAQEVDLLIPHYKEKYICSNVEFEKNGTWHPFGTKYRYFLTPIQGARVLSFAFLFDFNRNNVKTKVTPIVDAIEQDWFQEVLDMYPPESVDLLLIVGHLPITRKWSEVGVLHAKLRTYYPDTKIQYFGGHSHIRDFVVYDEKLTGLQSGRFCETVGFLSLNLSSSDLDARERYFRSYIDFNTDLFEFHSGAGGDFETKKGKEVSQLIHQTRKDLNLDMRLGEVAQNYYMDYVPISHPHSIFRLLTKRVLPLLHPQGNISVNEERIIIINTGSIRYDLYKGNYTVDSHYIVSPFQNEWVRISLPKRLAVKISPLLNRNDYIASAGSGTFSNLDLRPPHQRFMENKISASKFSAAQIPMVRPGVFAPESTAGKLSKGYVTHDDFGTDGDDTRHRPVINYPIPNVVQSMEFQKTNPDATVDVVFYSFLLPNIEWAMKELNHAMPQVDFYSDKYLGLLLDEYVQKNEV